MYSVKLTLKYSAQPQGDRSIAYVRQNHVYSRIT